MARTHGRMKSCPCPVCRCDKKVSIKRHAPCDYCSADTHRLDLNGQIVPR